MIRTLLLSSLVFCFSTANAAGVGAGASGFSNPRDLKGLCTTDNRDEFYFKEGTCQSLKEQLTADKCTTDLLEKLRQKMIKELTTPPPPGQEAFRHGLTCESRTKTDQWEKILKNKQAFGTVMMQFFAAVAIAESSWDTFNNLQKGAGANINAGAKGGVMNLTLTQMDNPKYNKDGCGCKVTNSETISASYWFWYLILGEPAHAQAAAGGKMAWTGRSPGPRDSHHSIQCGAYMALVEAAEDGVLFQGKKKKPGAIGAQPPPQPDGDKPKGAAKIYASLQDVDDPQPPPPPPANEDDAPMANNPKLDLVLKKVRNYCRKNVNENGGMIRTLADDFGDDGQLRNNTIK